MRRRNRTLRIAFSSALVLAVAAAGITMYRTESRMEEAKSTVESQQENNETEEMAQGQLDAMESGVDETQDVTVNEAESEHTEELDGEESASSESVVPEAETVQNDAAESENTAEETANESEEGTVETGNADAETLPVLDFTEDSEMVWPVNGEVAIDYSMDAVTYFPTLDLYKYNEALVLKAQSGEAVQAAANGQILSISENEETGTTMTVDLGNGYQAIYGQLKDITVEAGQTVSQGAILGYVSDPTKYYVNEGANLYFAMTKDGTPIDPMVYLEIVAE